MGITPSKEKGIKDLIESIREGMVDDKLNVDFFNCIYNLPCQPNKVYTDLSCFNILGDDTIIPLLSAAEHLKVEISDSLIEWCEKDKDMTTLPIYDIDNIDNEVDQIYFIMVEPDIERQIFENGEWYVIGKMKKGMYFTLYIYAPELVKNIIVKHNNNKPRRRLTFYKDIKNIRDDIYYKKFKKLYYNHFFTYIESL